MHRIVSRDEQPGLQSCANPNHQRDQPHGPLAEIQWEQAEQEISQATSSRAADRIPLGMVNAMTRP